MSTGQPVARTIQPAARTARLRPTAVNAILTEAAARREQGAQLVSLMRGEPDFSTPPHIVAAAEAALRAGRTAYPDNRGEPALREAVAAHLARSGLTYAPSEIVITSGATQGLQVALLAFVDPDDEVLIPAPAYDAYAGAAQLAGATLVPVPSPVVGERFAIDLQALAAACGPRTRAIILNTPWNPTGSVLTEAELAAVCELARQRDLLLISDEIYSAFVYHGQHRSPAGLSADARQRTIIVDSLSKRYAMTGWRLGYCAAPQAYAEPLYLTLQQGSRGPSTFVQDAAVVALGASQDAVAAMREELRGRRAQVCAALTAVPGCRPLPPEAGLFVMADCRELGIGSDQLRRQLLVDHGVVLVHGAAYGASAEGMLRVSFAAGGDNLARGLERLVAGLRSAQR